MAVGSGLLGWWGRGEGCGHRFPFSSSQGLGKYTVHADQMRKLSYRPWVSAQGHSWLLWGRARAPEHMLGPPVVAPQEPQAFPPAPGGP